MKRFLYILFALCLLASTMPLHAQSAKKVDLARSRSLNDQALYNAELGNYTEAVRLGTEALNIDEKVLGKEHPDYAISLSNLASYFSDLGNYTEAVRLGAEALNILEKVSGKKNYVYASALSNLASYNYYLGNYAEAVKLQTEEMNITEKVSGKEHPDYAISLHNLANSYAKLGNYTEALRLHSEALNIREQTLGKEHPDYAISLDNLAGSYADLGNYAEAIRLDTEALNIWKKVYGKEHPIYSRFLHNLAAYNYYSGNFAKTVRLEIKALDIFEKTLGKEHPNYAQLLKDLAYCYSRVGDYAEAIRLGTKALNIREKVLSKEHPDYVTSLSSLASYNFDYKQYDETSRLATEATTRNIRLICNTFTDLTANERNLFWQKYQDWFETDLPEYAYYIQTDSISVSAYNGVLMSKGLLLNSEIEMNRLLLESGDVEVMRLYNDMKDNRLMLDRLYEKPIAERVMSTDSLEAVIGKQEKELVQRSKVYGDYTKNLSIDWKQVQEKLGNKDIAVEFMRFPVLNDSTMYAALTLTKEDQVPHIIPLFEEKELDRIGKNAYYSSSSLGNLVWEPLAEQLAGKENIYFAPAGELYSIAIESIPCFEGDGLMSDRWNLYRLSSTRELALIKDKSAIKTGAVYGGLKYDMGEDALVEDSEKNRTMGDAGLNATSRSIADSLELRGGVKELPGTRIEAEAIYGMLTKSHVNTSLYMDSAGTEASFKVLSGKKTNMIHIATHGFYWTETEVKYKKSLAFLSSRSGDDRPRYEEDKAMTRSGLLFAGANHVLTSKSLPENVEDGILTANEISRLDLRGLELLVLSACQTGLGEITGDGVFGLQRGFKKAGANTLLMSLWKVDDDATRMLMTRFFENLTAGKDKHASLTDAQRHVREYETEKTVTASDGLTEIRKVHPYEDPQYWAAFILLDGID